MRLVLLNSQKSLITLEEEVEMLKLYIEMEKLRFKDAFTWSIRYSDTMGLNDLMIPPLLLQPFCENAIWHGLMHKNGPGHLSICFETSNSVLLCTIADNGIGRENAAKIQSGSPEHQKSMGLRLTAARLALFNDDHSFHTSYQVEDLKDERGEIAGTKVILKIRNHGQAVLAGEN